MSNKIEKFRFEVLRSDYNAVENIIVEYGCRGKLAILDTVTVIKDKDWTTTITVLGTEADFKDMYDELCKEWLLM